MIKFVRFRADHLAMFEWQSAQRNFMKVDLRHALELERDGVGWTGVDEMGVVGCAGFMPTPWGLACWAAFSDRLPQHVRPVMAFIRDRIGLRTETQICALVAHGHDKAARFARALDFQLERSPAGDEPEHRQADLYRLQR